MNRNLEPNQFFSLATFALFFPIFALSFETYQINDLPVTQLTASRMVSLAWFFVVVSLGLIGASRLSVMGFVKQVRQIELASWLLILYLLGAALSVWLNTPSSIKAWYRFCELAAAIFLIVVLVRLADRKYSELLNSAFITMSYLPAVIIIVFLGVCFFEPRLILIETEFERFRLGGYVYHPVNLALTLLLSQIAIGFRYLRGELKGAFFIRYSLLVHIMIALTDSRMGVLLLILTDVCVLAYLQIYYKGKKKGAQIFLVSSIMLMIGFLASGGNRFLLRLADFLNLLDASDFIVFDDLSTLNSRLAIWSTAWNGISENPYFGVGFGLGGKEYFLNNFEFVDAFKPGHSHNAYIEVAYSQGFIGGLPLLAFVFWAIIRCVFELMNVKRNLLVDNTLYFTVGILLLSGLLWDTFGYHYRAFSGCFFLLTCVFLTQGRFLPVKSSDQEFLSSTQGKMT